jgi:hypothetical protein
MLLNVGLSGGLIPIALLAAAFLYGFFKLWSDPRAVPDSLFLFLFVNGLAENVCFLVLDSAPMIVFTIALIWRGSDPSSCSGKAVRESLPLCGRGGV